MTLPFGAELCYNLFILFMEVSMSLPFRIYPVREEEVLRRSAMRNPSEQEKELMRECRRDAEYLLEYHIKERNRPLDLIPEDDPLRETFAGCDSVIVFTASLGDAFRELAESHDEPEKDILYQGLAAERLDALVESYLDFKERSLGAGGAVLTPHFSYHWDGVPEDAFTATRIVGVSFHPQETTPTRCRTCFAENCPSRRERPQKTEP